MPLLSLRQAFSAAILLIFLSAQQGRAQSCYYPDGETLSEDVVCDATGADSACCPSNSFCLAGGLCVAGGVVSRGSCTDQTWGSPACAGYCKTVNRNAEVAITPCSTDTDSNTFACGLSGDCSADTFSLPTDTGLLLRPSQIAALVGSLSGPSSIPTESICPSSADGDGGFSTAALAGVGAGVGVPLLLALVIAIVMLQKEKRRFSKPKLMYNLPDDCKDEFAYRHPPPPPQPQQEHQAVAAIHPAMRPSSRGDTGSHYSSRRGSVPTAAETASTVPTPRAHAGTFMERYESMKKNAQGQPQDTSRHELESTPPYREVDERHEMGDYRRSQSSQLMRRAFD